MSDSNTTPDFNGIAKSLKKDMRRYAKVKAVNFFQDSFKNQGFTDGSLEAWEQRKGDVDLGRKILVKSSALMNSIRVMSSNQKQIVFGSNEEHAEIHNEGGTMTIRITKKSRKYFWYMYKATGREMWKWMALSKKQTMTITIPKRQFIGESKTLMKDLENWTIQQIEKRFKL